MAIYNKFILPTLCDLVMRNKLLNPYRQRVVGSAEGRVLEIGAGSGLNLKFYDAGVSEVVALDPDPKLIAMAKRNAKEAARPIRFLEASAERIPLDPGSIDTVVMTWSLCTIPNAIDALREMKRVLKPQGRLLFIEHGLANDTNVRTWQNRLTPIWKRVAGGCHLNRPIGSLIEQGGFNIDRLETFYTPGLKSMEFQYEGSARPNR